MFLFITTLIGACGSDSSQDSAAMSDSPQVQVDDEGASEQVKRVYLKSALEPDYDPYIVDHEGSDKLVICHVPPGNPLNSKTKMIGPSSIDAHLNHEPKAMQKNNGKDHHSHGHKDCSKDDEGVLEADIYKGGDYLGPCGNPELKDVMIVLDDPVFETDGLVCVGLRGPALYDCLKEHDQNITIEL